MNLLLAAAMAAALSCPAPQEAPLPAGTQPAPQTEAAAPQPAEPEQRTVCAYETVEGSDVPERVCRTLLQLRLVRLPTPETSPTAQQEPAPSTTASNAER